MRERKFSLFLLHTYDWKTRIRFPKIDLFLSFCHPCHFERDIIFRVLIWLHTSNKLYWNVFRKTHRDKSRANATTMMELFVAFVSSYFTKNPNIGAMGVLNAPLEYYDVFWNLCRWSNYVLQNCSLQLV